VYCIRLRGTVIIKRGCCHKNEEGNHSCWTTFSEIFIVLREWDGLSPLQLSLILLHQMLVNGDLSRGQSGSSDKLQGGVSNKFPCQPQEGLLEVVVRLGRDFEVLQVLLAVEGDSTSLHFALLDIDFVSTKDDGDVLANTFEVTMPVGNIFVGDAGSDVEHDDTALALNVVPIPKTAKLLLSSSVPYVEADRAKVGGELQRVDFDPESGDVFLFEFARQMALYEGSLSSATISNENELECGDCLFSHNV